MMEMVIVYWRDIPSQVSVKTGRRSQIKRLLPDRFQQAIDTAAMRGDARDSDAYLADWRRGDPTPVEGDDPEKAVDDCVAALDAAWDRDRLGAVARAGGWSPA
jgi:hypothetical protein